MVREIIMNKIRQGFAFVLLMSMHVVAFSYPCSDLLQKMDEGKPSGSPYLEGRTLCQVQDRFQKAVETLKAKGVENHDRIAEVLVPRFIGFPKWNQNKVQYKYDPRDIYKPAPITWNQWDETQLMIADKAKEFVKRTSIALATKQEENQIKGMMSAEFIENIHYTALRGLTSPVGQLRTTPEYGYNFNTKVSLKERETLVNRSFIPKSLYPDRPMLGWMTTKCYHELHYKDAIDVRLKWADNTFVFNEKQWGVGTVKEKTKEEDPDQMECGVIVYPSPENVKTEVDLWAKATNESLGAWMSLSKNNRSTPKESMEDPILTVAKIQRWLVTIHPLMDGNGRTSRLVMDYMLQVLQLPTPIIEDMDNDLYFSDEAWAHEVGKGILNSIKVLELCALDPSAPGCNQIPFAK